MSHNGGVETFLALAAVVAQESENDDLGLQAGPYAFFFFAALALSLVFILFSMRKQMRRVRVDESGSSDAERMGESDPTKPASDDIDT